MREISDNSGYEAEQCSNHDITEERYAPEAKNNVYPQKS